MDLVVPRVVNSVEVLESSNTLFDMIVTIGRHRSNYQVTYQFLLVHANSLRERYSSVLKWRE
jgi:hypothetical protein